MIMIWNQKEVFVGYSLQKLSEVRDTLAVNKIKYKYRVVNHNRRRGATGTFGENMEYANMYYVYVHKRDYDNACALLQKS